MEKEIFLAGGCFWGAQKYFSNVRGVVKTEVGYANGKTENPSYEAVCNEDTGHAETVRVVYDENIIGLSFLLDLYYKVIEPTSHNKQGNDSGSQYRTGIYFTDDEDKEIIINSIKKLQLSYDEPITIEVQNLEQFFKAEEYHQKYLDKNPDGYCHISFKTIEEVKNIKPVK